MADAPEPLTPERRSGRRFFWPGGLSARLLILTALFIALAGAFILPPSLAAFEERWLLDRVRAAELASLAEAAVLEISVRGRALLTRRQDAGGADLASDAHRLAGLAAQFGAADVAAGADQLERAASKNAATGAAFDALAAALDAFEAAA